MSKTASLAQRWRKFRPSKSLWFGSVVAASLITMFVGFQIVGWVTDGRAKWMATHAQAQLVASLCVQKFSKSEKAVEKFAAFKDMTTAARHNYIKEGGWADIKGIADSIPGSASLCAHKLARLDRHSMRIPAGI
jgi:hypothetical protein